MNNGHRGIRKHKVVRLGRSAIAAALAAGIALTGVTAASAATTSADTAAGATAGASGRFGPYGYGGVRLGMTPKQAEATRKIVRKRGASQCSGWDLKAHPTGRDSVGLYISKKLGVALIAAPKGAKTPEGITIGSTMKQVKKAYPRLDTTGNYPVAAVPGNPKALYYFLSDRGKVYELTLALKNQDCTN
ncbi:hypothetical protein [Streptosporangium pseudovulgare]|uniref:Uncharacterized protein n=1 Tax=Streptosporangium pseudovulgare TaxID=35765 RepID=A0ABQ2RG80_9ACTN|nr:hypothetical protein [Streptosporangium pseudovulgare]GGQ27892.1 hypothetical protein GCM10010140_67590 [Streptosporangium pseudovulgare]